MSAEEVRAHIDTMIELGEALPGMQTGPRLVRWPDNCLNEPMVIDTDVGGDADDALALVAAARSESRLSLVLTCDETGPPLEYGQRARFARHLLDTVGRSDVPVIAGVSRGGTEYYVVDGLVPAAVRAAPGGADAVVAAVSELARRGDGPIRWVGMGPLSNLAHLVAAAPHLASRLAVTQMGGAVHYRHPDRAEHNIRLDVAAAQTVLRAVAAGVLPTPRFVISDTTFTDDIAVHANHPLHRALVDSTAPWASLLDQHLHRWYQRYPASLQHDALTLSAALALPFVRCTTTRIVADGIGRWGMDPGGVPLRLSASADYAAFMRWLSSVVAPAAPTPQPNTTSGRRLADQ